MTTCKLKPAPAQCDAWGSSIPDVLPVEPEEAKTKGERVQTWTQKQTGKIKHTHKKNRKKTKRKKKHTHKSSQ